MRGCDTGNCGSHLMTMSRDNMACKEWQSGKVEKLVTSVTSLNP